MEIEQLHPDISGISVFSNDCNDFQNITIWFQISVKRWLPVSYRAMKQKLGPDRRAQNFIRIWRGCSGLCAEMCPMLRNQGP